MNKTLEEKTHHMESDPRCPHCDEYDDDAAEYATVNEWSDHICNHCGNEFKVEMEVSYNTKI